MADHSEQGLFRTVVNVVVAVIAAVGSALWAVATWSN